MITDLTPAPVPEPGLASGLYCEQMLRTGNNFMNKSTTYSAHLDAQSTASHKTSQVPTGSSLKALRKRVQRLEQQSRYSARVTEPTASEINRRVLELTSDEDLELFTDYLRRQEAGDESEPGRDEAAALVRIERTRLAVVAQKCGASDKC